MKKTILLSDDEHKVITSLIGLMREIEQNGDIKEQTDTLDEAFSKGIWNDNHEFLVSFTPEQLEALEGCMILAEDFNEHDENTVVENEIDELDLLHLDHILSESGRFFVEED